jgi:hypothetical protein
VPGFSGDTVRKTNNVEGQDSFGQWHFTHRSPVFNPISEPQVFPGGGAGISNTNIIKDFDIRISLCEFGQANALFILLGSFSRVAGFGRVVYRFGRCAVSVCLFGELELCEYPQRFSQWGDTQRD